MRRTLANGWGALIGAACLVLIPFSNALAGEAVDPTMPAPAATESTANSSSTSAKRFDDVLNDLLNEFSYDLKTNQITDLKNVSVRKVALNEAIPKSYETYLESLVLERMKLHSKIRTMQCTTCRVRKSVLENGRLTLTSPINNNADLDQIARELNIETWVDVALLYQETNMVLSFNAFDAKTKELLWARVYNSEQIYRKKGRPMAVSQRAGEAGVEEGKNPKGSLTFGISLGYHVVPNVNTTSNMLGVTLRGSERFDEGRSEVGAFLMTIVDPDTLLSDYTNVEGDPAATGEAKEETNTKAIRPFPMGFGLFAAYFYNFFGEQENLEVIRWSANVGGGTIVAPGYMSLTARAGVEMKFGKHFALNLAGLYSAPTTISIKSRYQYTTKGGPGGELSFGALF